MARRLVLTTVFLLAASGAVWAQATASITGRVVDQTGAVLPGVSVTITNTGTGQVRETVTNGDGLYSLPALERGVYDAQAQLAGFAEAIRKGVDLVTGATLSVDFQMGVAQLSESLTVSGQAPLIEATQSVVSHSIRQTEVAQLPMLNRSLAAMMTLLPGAREVGITGSTSHGAAVVVCVVRRRHRPQLQHARRRRSRTRKTTAAAR